MSSDEDEDLREMAALRRSSHFKQHIDQYGDRSQVRAQREREWAQFEKHLEEEKVSLRKRRREEKEDKKDEEDKEDIQKPSDEIRSMLPMSFGMKEQNIQNNPDVHAKKRRKVDPIQKNREDLQLGEVAKIDPDAEIAKLKAKLKAMKKNRKTNASLSSSSNSSTSSSSDDSSSDDSSDDDAGKNFVSEAKSDLYHLPITHEAELSRNGHTRAVCSLALDKSGSRLLSGGYDYMVRMWNFAGMNEALRSFRQIEPEEGHQVARLQYNIRGSNFLAITGSAHLRIFDRDGHELVEFSRGDPYIHDKSKTTGHVAAITDGMYHPLNDIHLLTCGEDGTVRTWDVNLPRRNTQVIKYTRGRVIPATCVSYSPDAKIILCAGTDGGISMWATNTSMTRPKKVVKNAHDTDTSTSDITFSPDGRQFVSRGGDHTLKIWDIRQLRAPLRSFSDLHNAYAQTNTVFSPDENLVVTGTSSTTDGGRGTLCFFDIKKLTMVQQVSLSQSSVISTIWHPAINQIFCGSSDGKVYGMYTPDRSTKGLLLAIGRKARKKDPSDFQAIQWIRHPNALPMFRDEKRNKTRYDRKKKQEQQLPLKPLDSGSLGTGGRLATESSLMGYRMRQLVADEIGEYQKGTDPREAILRYANQAAADPMYLGRAYKNTQPVPVFQEMTDEQLAEAQKNSMYANTRYEERTLALDKAKAEEFEKLSTREKQKQVQREMM